MSHALPKILWSLVAVAVAVFAVVKFYPSEDKQEVSDTPPGMVLVDVPWEHLPDVDRFKLVDQNGDEFDSAELTGQAYVVSFFFASCPTFCFDLNKELERINGAVRDTDIRFLTISVDPENDTPEVLKKYADGFGATPDRWAFLTGESYIIKEVGENNFNVVVDRDTHTDSILLVDKWGRYRDRFKWDQPYDMKRFVKVAKAVAAEEAPPFGKTINTRNVLAGVKPPNMNTVRWIKEFHLTERSGEPFFSRDLTGEVWIGNFFFSNCPGICKEQNEYLRDLQIRLGDKSPRIVSITTDAANDSPEQLRKYAKTFNADNEGWLFLTGGSNLIERVGSEFFHAQASEGHHSSLLYVVDRWGEVRGSYDWQDVEQEKEMLQLIQRLKMETVPPKPEDPEKPGTESEQVSDGEQELEKDDESTSKKVGSNE